MLYQFYEWNHAAVAPFRKAARWSRAALTHDGNPLSGTLLGKMLAAGCDVFENATKRYGKPAFGLDETDIEGRTVPVLERVVWEKPFCRLIHFEREPSALKGRRDPTLLIVAPLSGHYATLLRGTVETLLPTHEVYITDWTDARMVPLSEGRFDLDDYIDYVIAMCDQLGPDCHVLAVCQPSVPVLAAVALMSEDHDPALPRSMTLMGGPIDTRLNPTEVNRLATERGTKWYERHAIHVVPAVYPGFLRRVYPGFLQLSGFMAMNFDRHAAAQWDYFDHLVQGDGDETAKHRRFYDEYLAVMDLTEEFYLQTVERVFVNHELPRGEFHYRGRRVKPEAITATALFTVEGENDDISGVGQTEAAHRLCSSLPAEMKAHHVEPVVGHYGVFNGSRWRQGIAPKIAAFIRAHDEAPGRKAGTAR